MEDEGSMIKKRYCIYEPSDKWIAFKEAVKREGKSISAKIDEWIDEYLSVHGDGNPQTLLRFAGLPKTLPRYKTCTHSPNKRLHDGTFYCRNDKGLGYWKNPLDCRKCENYREDKNE